MKHANQICRGVAKKELECRTETGNKLRNWWRIIENNVPLHDRHIFLENLEPSDKSRLKIDRQQEVIAYLQANPTKSYAFFGPAGTSKTTFGVALYENAVWESVFRFTGVHVPIFWLSAKYLLDEYVVRENDRHDASDPTVSRPLIQGITKRMNGTVPDDQTPRLFLEEIDKVRYSEFKTYSLFEVIDAIYGANGQFVFNSNLTLEEFTKQFYRPSDAEALVRRIGEMGKVYNFFEEGWTEEDA
jgi:hypothetical protein